MGTLARTTSPSPDVSTGDRSGIPSRYLDVATGSKPTARDSYTASSFQFSGKG